MKLHIAVDALTPPPFEAAGLQRAFVLHQFILEVSVHHRGITEAYRLELVFISLE